MSLYGMQFVLGQQIQIGPHTFSGHTARRIMELGAPVFTKMTHIAHLAQVVTNERRALSDKMVEAGLQVRSSKDRVSNAQALVGQVAATHYDAAAYDEELASAKAQLEIAQANYDALASRAAKLDGSAVRVFDSCKKALASQLGESPAVEIFQTMGWN